MQTLVLEELVAGWEPLPGVVQSSCVVQQQLWGMCVTVLHIRPPAPSPHFHSEWGGEESLARCGRLYQFQIVYRIIFSDSTRRRGPEMNLRRGTASPRSLECSITLKRQRRRLSESFRPNQFCNLRDCRWLMGRSPVWVKTYCFLYLGGLWIISVNSQSCHREGVKTGAKCRQSPGWRWKK